MARVIHKLKATLLDPESEHYDAEALTRYFNDELPNFEDNYGENWGIDTEDIWYPEEEEGKSIQFVAEDCLRSIAEELSDDHPGLLFTLYYCAPGDFSGIAEFVAGGLWEERFVESTAEGRALSDWHKEELEGEET